MSTLLVIGGSGFFGKSILDSFKRGQLEEWAILRIIIISRNSNRLRYETPELLDDRVQLLDMDICTADFLPEADYVIHAATSADVRNYLNNAKKERNNTEKGVLNYCELSKRFHKSSKILYVSSGAVYGIQPPELLHISEEYRVRNKSAFTNEKIDYAISKQKAEDAFRQLAALDFKVSIARCFSFVGRWLPRDQHFAIGNFLADGIAGCAIKVKADHQVYRSYMYADDLVRWLMVIVDNSSNSCEVYNVGSDHAVTMLELSDIFAEIFNTKVRKVLYTSSKVDRYIPSIAKAKDKLDLEVTVQLKNSIILSI
jgi:dTDP-glucose 4,6-dehydratase